jgi:hypothetical protein
LDVRARNSDQITELIERIVAKGDEESENVVKIIDRLVKESLTKNTQAIDLLKSNLKFQNK